MTARAMHDDETLSLLFSALYVEKRIGLDSPLFGKMVETIKKNNDREKYNLNDDLHDFLNENYKVSRRQGTSLNCSFYSMTDSDQTKDCMEFKNAIYKKFENLLADENITAINIYMRLTNFFRENQFKFSNADFSQKDFPVADNKILNEEDLKDIENGTLREAMKKRLNIIRNNPHFMDSSIFSMYANLYNKKVIISGKNTTRSKDISFKFYYPQARDDLLFKQAFFRISAYFYYDEKLYFIIQEKKENFSLEEIIATSDANESNGIIVHSTGNHYQRFVSQDLGKPYFKFNKLLISQEAQSKLKKILETDTNPKKPVNLINAENSVPIKIEMTP